MRILLLGGTGQLGQELARALTLLGTVVAPGRSQLDISQTDTIRAAVRDLAPSLIVNASAFTAVDKAEAERDLAFRVNALAPGILAAEAATSGAGLIHFSTDFVFDGRKRAPYTELDVPHPLNAYGQSKLEGEQAITETAGVHLILRTSWVYRLHGSHECFPKKVIGWAGLQKELRVVDDQVGTPTWARDLAQAVLAMVAMDTINDIWEPRATGVFHLASAGQTSRFGWAKATLDILGLPTPIKPAKSREFPTDAVRPGYSVLDCEKFRNTFSLAIPPWESSYALALNGM